MTKLQKIGAVSTLSLVGMTFASLTHAAMDADLSATVNSVVLLLKENALGILPLIITPVVVVGLSFFAFNYIYRKIKGQMR